MFQRIILDGSVTLVGIVLFVVCALVMVSYCWMASRMSRQEAETMANAPLEKEQPNLKS